MKKLFIWAVICFTTSIFSQNATKINESFTAIIYMSRDEGMSIEAYFALGDYLYAGIGESH